jgi:hypothetical protein
MARSTTRIGIPTKSPDEMLHLASSIQAEHTEAGGQSPLTGIDMESFAARVADAAAKRAEAAKLAARAEALNGEAAKIIGIAKGQTSKTAGTLYYDICKARDILLIVHRGVENNLEPWGFRVVTGTAAAPRRTARTNPAPAASLDS